MTSKVVAITGASSGIGKACAVVFAQAGWQVFGIARRSDRLQNLANEIANNELQGEFTPFVASVSDAKRMQEAAQLCQHRFGRVDILIANAGVGHRGGLVDSNWDEIETLLRTNIDGVLHSIRAFVPHMQEQKGGHVIVISSVAHNLRNPYAASYAASKAFVNSIAHSLRLELRDENITVTTVVIGRTETEFNQSRLGKGARPKQLSATMSAERVATAILRATKRKPASLYVRWFDRFIVLGNMLIPNIIGRIAERRYR